MMSNVTVDCRTLLIKVTVRAWNPAARGSSLSLDVCVRCVWYVWYVCVRCVC